MVGQQISKHELAGPNEEIAASTLSSKSLRIDDSVHIAKLLGPLHLIFCTRYHNVPVVSVSFLSSPISLMIVRISPSEVLNVISVAGDSQAFCLRLHRK